MEVWVGGTWPKTESDPIHVDEYDPPLLDQDIKTEKKQEKTKQKQNKKKKTKQKQKK